MLIAFTLVLALAVVSTCAAALMTDLDNKMPRGVFRFMLVCALPFYFVVGVVLGLVDAIKGKITWQAFKADWNDFVEEVGKAWEEGRI